MINRIRSVINENNLIPKNSTVIVGLSGGPDSVFLLHILNDLKKDLNIKIIAAHLDHEWRKNSSLDAEFCKKICDDLKIKFITAKISELKLKPKFKGSKEELGRTMRRFFLEQVAKENKSHRIALAHHLQDQQETFFIRLIRGTSLSGLVSMKPLDGGYIRPLLEIDKKEILKYLDDNGIVYLVDPSNESEIFLRNRIRKKVLPELQKCDKRFNNNFIRTLNKLKEAEEFLEKITLDVFAEVSFIQAKKINIDLKKLFALDPFLQKRIIFHWLERENVKFELTEKFLHEILRFLINAQGGTHQIHHDWSIQKKKNIATIQTKK